MNTIKRALKILMTYVLLFILSDCLSGCAEMATMLKGVGDGLQASAREPEPISQQINCQTINYGSTGYIQCY